MRSLTGDVRDRAALGRAFDEGRPEIVIHMAAQSLVRRSYRNPAETYETNVMGTVNLLEAVRARGDVRAVVNVTTDKVYEQHAEERSFREDEPKGGHDPYSNSKACSELVTAAYRDSFFGPGATALATARAGNVIGGGDWGEDRLIPDLMRGVLAGSATLIRHPEAVRPWQHVLNPLSGYLMLAERMWDSHDYAEAWNFGPSDRDAQSVRAVIARLSELWGEEIPWEQDRGDHPHEAPVLRLDSSKAAERLGWDARLGSRRGAGQHRGLVPRLPRRRGPARPRRGADQGVRLAGDAGDGALAPPLDGVGESALQRYLRLPAGRLRELFV